MKFPCLSSSRYFFSFEQVYQVLAGFVNDVNLISSFSSVSKDAELVIL